MKFALIDGNRCEPTPGATGQCPGCGQEVIAKCGSLRLWHWSHKGRRSCDPWWEPETEWHRAWKNLFPKEWQEIPCRADDGELHIADVKSPNGLVLEFQHSAITPEERQSRERFHRRMLWIVDGTRLKHDRPRIDRELDGWRNKKEMKFDVAYYPEWTFPKRWLTAEVPVLFDFDGLSRREDCVEEQEGKPPSVMRSLQWWQTRGAMPDPLICLMPNRPEMSGIYFVLPRERFVEVAVDRPDVMDGAVLARRYIDEREKRIQAMQAMRRGRRSWRF